jgi:hypothetical protein
MLIACRGLSPLPLPDPTLSPRWSGCGGGIAGSARGAVSGRPGFRVSWPAQRPTACLRSMEARIAAGPTPGSIEPYFSAAKASYGFPVDEAKLE